MLIDVFMRAPGEDDPLVHKRPSELCDVGIRHKAELGDGLADTFLDQSFVVVSVSIGNDVGCPSVQKCR